MADFVLEREPLLMPTGELDSGSTWRPAASEACAHSDSLLDRCENVKFIPGMTLLRCRSCERLWAKYSGKIYDAAV